MLPEEVAAAADWLLRQGCQDGSERPDMVSIAKALQLMIIRVACPCCGDAGWLRGSTIWLRASLRGEAAREALAHELAEWYLHQVAYQGEDVELLADQIAARLLERRCPPAGTLAPASAGML